MMRLLSHTDHHSWFWLLLIAQKVLAWQLFSPASTSGFGEICSSILTQNITACNNLAKVFDPSVYYDDGDLISSCNATCGSALSAWYADAQSACSNVTFINDYGDYAPVASVVGQLGFNFNQTCLQVNHQYCNLVVGNIANASNSSTEVTMDAPCDSCIMSLLYNQAESPFSNGPLVFSESLYQSYTSSCASTGPPLTVTAASQTLATTTESGPVNSAASVTGTSGSSQCSNTYQPSGGSSCNGVAVAAGTATWWLLLDNDLPAYCANFTQLTTGTTLCINHPCTTYTVTSLDNCTSIAEANNVTVTQLQAWNPWLDDTCYNINKTIGTAICVTQPGTQYIAPSSAIGSPSVAVSAVPIPTNIAQNTTTDCGRYYSVQPGDDCDLVILKYGLSLTDFLILNPEINVNCTNLYAYESYCVEPVGSINDYPGSPFYGINSTTSSGPEFDSLPISNYTPIIPLQTYQAAPGTSANCSMYLSGTQLTYNYSQVSDCLAAAISFDTTLDNLQMLNPSINTTSASCGFVATYNYCILNGTTANSTAGGTTASTGALSLTTSIQSLTMSSTPLSSTSTSATTSSASAIPSPTQANSISRNCNQYAEAVSGDYCSQFAAASDITPSQLYNWNQVLGVNGSNCGSDFWADEYYCVGVAIPSPTQANSIPGNCDVYAAPISGDGCYSFAQRNNITTEQLYAWNAVLGTNGENCGSHLWLNTYYCTGVNGQLSS